MAYRKFKCALAVLSLLLYGATTFCQTRVPDDWQKVDAEGLFTFYLPPEMKKSPVQGVDSFYREYSDGRLTFSFVYEPGGVLSYDSREGEYGKDYQEIPVEVDGTRAYLFIYTREAEEGRPRTFNADVHVGDLPHAQVKLWMWAGSTNKDDIEIARRIFQTVRFTKEKRARDD